MLQRPDQPPPAPAESPLQPDTQARAAALIAAVEDAYAPAPLVPTSYRDDTPLPAVGTTPPVIQPGRPPMSQRATDMSGLIISTGVAALPIGLGTSAVLWASGEANLLVVACVCAAPTSLILALARLLRRGREVAEAAPPVHHHHYAGPVHQDHSQITTTTRGVIARTTNETH
ncbi:hypothetical protein AB0E27_42820 [Streptomyces sparsogenes]|uniref:hypothetical protein n=1 Tax=Streptomyces sparsogenes TaxID=67365 RepID=UPI0033EFFF6E